MVIVHSYVSLPEGSSTFSIQGVVPLGSCAFSTCSPQVGEHFARITVPLYEVVCQRKVKPFVKLMVNDGLWWLMMVHNIWLVVTGTWILWLSMNWECHHPIWLIFFRGVETIWNHQPVKPGFFLNLWKSQGFSSFLSHWSFFNSSLPKIPEVRHLSLRSIFKSAYVGFIFIHRFP